MLKSKKYLKLLFSATAATTAATATSLTMISCGHKKTPPSSNNWDEFKKAALGEKVDEIVENASVTAKGWDITRVNDFSFVSEPKVGIDGSTVVTTIKSTFNNNTAVFTATYVTNSKYVVSDWACTTQPTAKATFADFEAAAKNTLAKDIVANASIKATGWDDLKNDTFTFDTKPIVGIAGSTMVAKIKSAKNENNAVFTARYSNGEAYKVSDWKCTTQPSKDASWNKFITDAEAATTTPEKLTAIFTFMQGRGDKLPNSLVPTTENFKKNVRVDDNTLIKTNVNTHKVIFEIIYPGPNGGKNTIEIVATKEYDSDYTMNNFTIKATTPYSKWYDSAINLLSNVDKSKSDPSLAQATVHKGDQTKTPNLYKISQEGIDKSMYASSYHFATYKEDSQILEFKVTLLLLKDDTIKIQNVGVNITYASSFGDTFALYQLSALSVVSDGTLPNFDKTTNPFAMYN